MKMEGGVLLPLPFLNAWLLSKEKLILRGKNIYEGGIKDLTLPRGKHTTEGDPKVIGAAYSHTDILRMDQL